MKNVSFTCDACGLKGDRSPYLCLLCNLMFHIRCVYFPNELQRRISSHATRLDHSSRVPGNWYCGCGSVHSDVVCGNIKARAFKDVDEYEAVSMLILDEDGEMISHFTHEHYQKFQRDGQVDDVNKRCHICKLPAASTPHYVCMECDFFLHERCTKLPRKKRSMLHNHPLTLELSNCRSRWDAQERNFCCNACGQLNDGVSYTFDPGFNLDVGCASITFPFKSAIHPHPLTFKSTDKKKCGVCELWASPVLSCEQCDFHLGFDCAQLPVLARHKYDKHPLILDITKDEYRGGDYWCEVCEKKVDKNAILYTCNEISCCSTFHTHCVAGGLNLELGLRFKLFGHKFMVEDNALATPRYCCICGLGCKGPRVIKSNQGGDKYLCSSSCLMRNRRLLHNL